MTKKTAMIGRKDPWQDPEWEVADASAVQAVFGGRATPDQQKRAINFIVNEICALPYLPRDPKSQSNTDFALGKHAVGHFIVKLMRLNLAPITGKREQG